MRSKANGNEHINRASPLTDTFAIKNFVLTDSSRIPEGHSLEQPFFFDGFVMGVCIKGSASIKVNFREFGISEGMVFSILPNQIFSMVRHSPDFIIETLFLSSDYILQMAMPRNFNLLKSIGDDPGKKVDREVMQDILELHALIAKHHRMNGRPFREDMTKALIFALLVEIASVYAGSGPASQTGSVSRQEQLADRFLSLLIENFRTERSVAFYAGKLCLTPKYLSTAVRKVTGHSILDWINTAVIIEAKTLLKGSDHTVLQISEELNFANPSFFGRFFKQHTGKTPLKYRNG